ncbi:diflavin flavoprotein [Pantanalinema rosaneae CENA516]|uniref:diflavin flavoprotein n=1 Tax=Pantanalinema rosaneae TaxID=1620701 RepID=UPI003D6E32F7
MADVKPRDVQVAPIGENTTVLRSRTWDRLKFEVEYARQRGTTANSYLIQASKSALIDPPGGSFTQIYVTELHQQVYFQKLNYLILGHVNPNRMETLKVLLELAAQAIVICSKPGAIALKSAFPDLELRIEPVRGDEVLDLGMGHELQFCFVPTPRWPDALCTYDPKTCILYTDKLFGAHVCDEEVMDEHWRSLEADRAYYFNCLHAVQAPQVEAAMERLSSFPARIYAPAHGPIVRHSFSRLTLDYQLWCQQQQTKELRVALLYTSAYGNTATVAQAIAQGITEAEVAVQSINCEFATPAEITTAIDQCDGFIIGSPTLGGHAPTQIQTALGIILSTAAKTKVAGVFGSYGWSGEAVDLLESKLQDAGYPFGFEPIRVKFAPTDEVLQQCQAAGSEFAQTLKKSKKAYAPRQMAAEAQTDRTGQAVGRIPGSLCVITANLGGTQFGFLTSWVSQASFSPPGLTIAVAKNHAAELLIHPGEQFVINILKEGRNVRRHFLKQREPGEYPFADVATAEATNGCPILTEALAYLECTVQNRMECGDHWLLYAVVNNGKVLEPTGVTAVNHRKSGNQY